MGLLIAAIVGGKFHRRIRVLKPSFAIHHTDGFEKPTTFLRSENPEGSQPLAILASVIDIDNFHVRYAFVKVPLHSFFIFRGIRRNDNSSEKTSSSRRRAVGCASHRDPMEVVHCVSLSNSAASTAILSPTENPKASARLIPKHQNLGPRRFGFLIGSWKRGSRLVETSNLPGF